MMQRILLVVIVGAGSNLVIELQMTFVLERLAKALARRQLLDA